MKEILRHIENGEPLLPTDEFFTQAFKWKRKGDVKPGEVMTDAHHPHRRREVVPEPTDRLYSRDEFACAAMAGMCADTRPIEDTMKKKAGGQRFPVTDVVACTAYEYADAMIRARDGVPPKDLSQLLQEMQNR